MGFDRYYLESSLYDDGLGRADRGRAAGVGPYLRAGRRAVAANHRLRRRQGPRDAQVRRQLHLLRPRRRLSHHEVGARLRDGGQHPGLRPSRDHRARSRRAAGAGLRDPAGLSGLCAAQDGEGRSRRRGGQDLQARGQLRDAARPDRMVRRRRHGPRPRCRPVLPGLAQGRQRVRVRRRPRARPFGREPGLLRPVRPCPDLLDRIDATPTPLGPPTPCGRRRAAGDSPGP